MKPWSRLKDRFGELCRQFLEPDYPEFCKSHGKNSELFVLLHEIILKFPEKSLFSKVHFNLLNSILHDFLGNGRDGEKNRRLILILCAHGVFDSKSVADRKKSFSRVAQQLVSPRADKLISDVQKREDAGLLYPCNFLKIKDSMKSMKINGPDKELVTLLCAGNFFYGKTDRMRSEIAELFRTDLPGEIVEFIHAEDRIRKIALARKTLMEFRNLAVQKKRLLERKILEFRVALIESALRTWSLIVRKKKVSIPVSSILLCFAVFMIFFVKNERFIPSPKSFEIKNDFALIDFDSMERNEKLRQRSLSGGDMRIEDFENESQKQQSAEFLDSKLSAEIKGLSFDGMFFTGRMKILFMEKFLTDSGIKNIGFKGTHALDKKEGE